MSKFFIIFIVSGVTTVRSDYGVICTTLALNQKKALALKGLIADKKNFKTMSYHFFFSLASSCSNCLPFLLLYYREKKSLNQAWIAFIIPKFFLYKNVDRVHRMYEIEMIYHNDGEHVSNYPLAFFTFQGLIWFAIYLGVEIR